MRINTVNGARNGAPKIGVPRVPVFHTPTQRNTPIQRNALPPRARAVRRGLSHCSVRFSHCLPRADVRGTRCVAFWVGVLRWVFGVWDPPRAFWVTQFSRNFRAHFCTFDGAISRDLDGLACLVKLSLSTQAVGPKPRTRRLSWGLGVPNSVGQCWVCIRCASAGQAGRLFSGRHM